MKGISLFANVGIGELMLEQLGVKFILANEIDKKRSKFYKSVYPDTHVVCGDITDENVLNEIVAFSRKNSIDFVMATPPCQGMSTAGSMKKNDSRNSLIMHAIDVVKKTDPKYVIFENVPQQINTKLIDKGTSKLIPEIVIEELGNKYNIEYKIVNAYDFGVAQKRRRLIFLMTKKNIEKKWSFPETNNIKRKNVVDVIGNLPSFESIPTSDTKISSAEFYKNKYEKTNYFHPYHKPSRMANRHIEAMLRTPEGKSAFENEIHFPKKNNGEKMKGFKNTFKRIKWSEPAPTVTMQNGNIGSQENGHPGRNMGNGIYSDARVLSIFEIMRIMSIPDDWKIPEWASETFVRSVIGEGVPPLMIKEFFLELLKEVKKNA